MSESKEQNPSQACFFPENKTAQILLQLMHSIIMLPELFFFFLIQNFGYSRLPVGLKLQLLTVITWSTYFLESYVFSFLSPNFWVMHVLYCLWAWSNCNNFPINQPLIIGFWFMPPTTPYLINYPVSFLIRNYTSTWLLFLHSSVSPTVTKAS